MKTFSLMRAQPRPVPTAKPHPVAVMFIAESMDCMAARRSHELWPSDQLRLRNQTRRFFRRVASSIAGIVTLVLLVTAAY